MICEYCGGDAASGCGPITTCGRTEHYSKIDCAAFLLLQVAEMRKWCCSACGLYVANDPRFNKAFQTDKPESNCIHTPEVDSICSAKVHGRLFEKREGQPVTNGKCIKCGSAMYCGDGYCGSCSAL